MKCGVRIHRMRRAYIAGWRDKESVGMRTPVEVFFGFRAEEAHAWPSEEEAQRHCPFFDSLHVRVSWAEGGEHICKGFQVEEHSPRQFLIFCDGPFTFTAAGSRAKLATAS